MLLSDPSLLGLALVSSYSSGVKGWGGGFNVTYMGY